MVEKKSDGKKVVDMKASQALKHDAELNVYQRMVKVMADLQGIGKSGKADQRMGGFSYVKHDDVMQAVHPLLVKHGLVLSTDIVADRSDPMVEVGKTAKGAQQYAAVLWVELAFVNVDKPEDRHVVKFPGIGIDTGDKGPGKAVSYALKTMLLKELVLPAGDDVDNEAHDTRGTGRAQKQSTTRTPPQRFWTIARKNKVPEVTVRRWFARNLGLDSTKDADETQLKLASQWAQEYPKLARTLSVEVQAAGLDDAGVSTYLTDTFDTDTPDALTLEEWPKLLAWVKDAADDAIPFGDPDDDDSVPWDDPPEGGEGS